MFPTVMQKAAVLLPQRLKRNLKAAFGVFTVEASLRNMKRNGFDPKVVIDVGAYTGVWTRMCKDIFPAAGVLMIEPQANLQDRLERTVADYNDVVLKPVLVGPDERESVNFYQTDSASSVLPEAERPDAPSISLPMTTLDAVTHNTIFAQADFIKLDVQGFELSVLSGGEKVLESAEAILMEVNLIEIYQGAPLFSEVVGFMAERGFQVYDVCTFFRRPYDRALWQMDVIFVNSTSALVSSKCWA